MADDKDAKAQALKIAIDQIEKQHGKGSVMRLGEGPIQQVEVISTGSISLDAALGIGGTPRGRVIEVFGPESSGKGVCGKRSRRVFLSDENGGKHSGYRYQKNFCFAIPAREEDPATCMRRLPPRFLHPRAEFPENPGDAS